MHHSQIKSEVRKLIADGTVLPAHPLALDAEPPARQTPSARADALLHRRRRRRPRGRRPHHAIRDPRRRPLPAGARARRRDRAPNWTKRPLAMVAGLAGPTRQAIAEADTARGIGYHAGLLSLAAMKSGLRRRDHRPLQGGRARDPAGRLLSAAGGRRRHPVERGFLAAFRRRSTMSIAIKIAPFNRYRTLDVLRGVAAAGALDRVALYTGNDDHILLDLTLPFDLRDNGITTRTYFSGGLLGHWSVWTRAPSSSSSGARRRATRTTVPGRSARARCPRHRLQQRVLRRRQQFSRLHRRLPRSAAATGPDGGHLVPRSRTKA